MKVFYKIYTGSKNSRENSYGGKTYMVEVTLLKPCKIYKKELNHMYNSRNLSKFSQNF